MTPEFVLSLPIPSRVLHPNGRPKFRAERTRAVKRARNLSRAKATAQGIAETMDGPCEAIYAYRFKRKSRHDLDGLTIWPKAYLDGVALAGVVHDDHQIRRFTVLTEHAANLEPCLTITIRPIAPGPLRAAGLCSLIYALTQHDRTIDAVRGNFALMNDHDHVELIQAAREVEASLRSGVS